VFEFHYAIYLTLSTVEFMRRGSLTLRGKKFSVALSVRGAKGIFLPFFMSSQHW
jgi:hypothetical protein